jgi:hypothetical protein
MPLYRKILKQAFSIAWNNKYLWFFGLFAALVGGGGIYELAVRNMPGSEALESVRRLRDIGFFQVETLRNIWAVIVSDPLSMLVVFAALLVAFIMFIFFVWLSIVSQAALIHSAGQYSGGKESDFQQGVDKGVDKFWPTLSLNIFSKMIVYVFSFLALAVISISGAETNPATFAAMLISILATITISFALKYSLGFMIIRGEGVFTSISSGIKLFIDNFLVSIEMAFILFVVNLLIAYATTVCVLVMGAPLLLMVKLMLDVAAGAGYWFMFIFSLVVILSFIVLVSSISTAFHVSAWTSLFTELVSRGGKSKLMRMLTKKAE